MILQQRQVYRHLVYNRNNVHNTSFFLITLLSLFILQFYQLDSFFITFIYYLSIIIFYKSYKSTTTIKQISIALLYSSFGKYLLFLTCICEF